MCIGISESLILYDTYKEQLPLNIINVLLLDFYESNKTSPIVLCSILHYSMIPYLTPTSSLLKN